MRDETLEDFMKRYGDGVVNSTVPDIEALQAVKKAQAEAFADARNRGTTPPSSPPRTDNEKAAQQSAREYADQMNSRGRRNNETNNSR